MTRVAAVTAQAVDRAADGPPAHQIVLGFARATPTATALVHGGRRLDYAGLVARVDILARRLLAEGVGPDVPVGVCVPRGPHLPVAFLAVLRAGGVYVPLDPAYPAERLAHMVRDAEPAVVLADPEVADRLPQLSCPVRDVEGPAPEVAAPEAWPRPHPENLAYLIYTSGSTGLPKGTSIPHRSLATMAAAQRASLAVGPGDRVLQWGSASFDASVFEMMLALGSGAELHTAPAEDLVPGPRLVSLLETSRVTVLTIMPSSLAALPPRALPDLRLLVVAGESLSTGVVDRWSPGRRMVNVYGTTESGIWDTLGAVTAGEAPTAGVALPGSRFELLDSALDPVPEGAVGEIVVAGDGLGRGYHHQPARTAASWLPDPSGAPGSRMYRTGDHGKRLPDGRLEVVGRTDQQVKVRGFRVELGEIDARLGVHPDVREHAVVADDPNGTGTRLTAFAVTTPRADVASDNLREFLATALPSYMVPSGVVLLDRMPLTPHGKLDRAALLALRPATQSTGPPPQTDAQVLVAQVWAEVLGTDGAGPEDDFFALGGDSIKATQVAARLQRAAGVTVSLGDLLSSRTLARLAEILEAALEAEVAAMSDDEVAVLVDEDARTTRQEEQ